MGDKLIKIFANISSLTLGIVLSSIFLISWAVFPININSIVIISILFLCLSILTYLSFKSTLEPKAIFITTIILSLLISFSAYLTRSVIVKYIQNQATQISSIPDQGIADAATAQVNNLLSVFNNNTNIIILISIVLVTYNIFPIINLIKTKQNFMF